MSFSPLNPCFFFLTSFMCFLNFFILCKSKMKIFSVLWNGLFHCSHGLYFDFISLRVLKCSFVVHHLSRLTIKYFSPLFLPDSLFFSVEKDNIFNKLNGNCRPVVEKGILGREETKYAAII